MNKNYTFKNKLTYVNQLKKDDEIKLELIVSSKSNISDDVLNQISNHFKGFYIPNFNIKVEKPKPK